MKETYRPVVAIVVVLVAMLAFAGFRKATGSTDKIPWRKTLAEARAESATSRKRVLAYFTATWCGPCQQMKESTWADPRVEAVMREAVVPVKIDVDQDPRAAQEFNVSGIPWIQLIEPDGTPGASRVGFTSADELLRWLSGI